MLSVQLLIFMMSIFTLLLLIKFTVMEMLSLKIFVHKMKRYLFIGSLYHYITEYNFLVNRVGEPFARSKMAVNHELKLCLSNFSRGIEQRKEGCQGTNITLIFKHSVDLFLKPYF